MTDAGPFTLLLAALAVGAAGFRGFVRREPWSAADDVTALRLSLILLVLLLVADRFGQLFSWPLVLLVSTALALDGVDGAVARRGAPTRAGAKFDERCDALLVLILSVALVPIWGWWCLLPGVMHYAFRATGKLRTRWQADLPPRLSRKVIAVLQGVLLTASASPLSDASHSPLGAAAPWFGIGCAAVAVGLLLLSFGRDIVYLERVGAEGGKVTAPVDGGSARDRAGTAETATTPSAGSLTPDSDALTPGAEQLLPDAVALVPSGGDAEFVSGEEDRTHLHRLRAAVDAVIVGASTVTADDPQLTVRACPGTNPLRVILDPRARIPRTSRVLQDASAPTLWLVQAGSAVPQLPPHVRVGYVAVDAHGHADPAEVLRVVREHVNGSILVEGGGTTVSAFFAAGLLDRLFLTTAPGSTEISPSRP